MTQTRSVGASNPILRSGAYSAATRRMIARVFEKSARGKIDFYGPSTMRGLGAGTDGSGNTNQIAKSIPTKFSEILAARGIPAEMNSAFGAGNTASVTTADARISFGSGWGAGSFARGGLGGPTISHTQANANPLVYTPLFNYDTVDVYYADNGVRPSFIVAINGVDVETVATIAGTTAIRKKSYTTTLGKNAISIRKADGSNASEVAIIGFDCYDSTNKKISVRNMGWSSSTAIDLANNHATPFPNFNWMAAQAIPLMAADHAFFMYGTNEWYLNNTDATNQADNTPTKLAAALDLLGGYVVSGGGGVTLCSFHEDHRTPTISGGFTQDDFNAAIKAKAKEKGWGFLDLAALGQSYAVMNPAGFYFDSVHRNGLGYTDLARYFADTIIAK